MAVETKTIFSEFEELSNSVDGCMHLGKGSWSSDVINLSYLRAREYMIEFEKKLNDLAIGDVTKVAYYQMVDCLRENTKEKYETKRSKLLEVNVQ